MSNHGHGFQPLEFTRIDHDESVRRARAFAEAVRSRRSVRHFSPDPVPLEAIRHAIAAAGTAPSGANQQPWRYVVVQDPEVKRRIREAAEAEERESYSHRMSQEWLDALAPLGTTWQKPYLEIVPYIIVCFRLDYGIEQGDDGTERRVKHYYPGESMGISVGLLIAALHSAGLATLTHTPSPMGFLNEVLGRPRNERPFVVIPIGYPADDCHVPLITKKPLDEIMLVV